MPRPRNPNRERAKQIWLDSGGQIALKDIASQLDVSDSLVRNWKATDKWETGDIVAQRNPNHCATKRAGAPKGNQNATGNIGGAGGPVGNDKAITHGFFRRIFPDDEETRAIVGDIAVMEPLDILWQNIVIQYTAIARSQRIMFVEDTEDHTQVLKRRKDSDSTEEREWEYQYSWDKQASFLQAQSRAMSTLEGLISRYESMLPTSTKVEEHRLRIQKLQAEVEKLRGGADVSGGLVVTVDYGDGDA